MVAASPGDRRAVAVPGMAASVPPCGGEVSGARVPETLSAGTHSCHDKTHLSPQVSSPLGQFHALEPRHAEQ